MGARGPKPTGKTPGRNVRVSDDLWEASKEIADAKGSSVSAEIVTFLKTLTGKI